jgi:protease-4
LKNAYGLAALGIALGLAGCISVFLVPPVLPLQETTLSGTGDEKILLIDVSGVIAHKAEGRGSAFPGPPDIVARVKEELELAAQDDHVKAVVLRINSPGGTVTASDQLYYELRQFKAARKIPIVAVFMDVGASGAYYVAMAADSVIAHPTSIVGSIGVVMLRMNVEGLLEKLGLETAAIKSGTMKDMGSPFRTMTDEERQVFQGAIMEFYNRFVQIVGEGRPGLKSDRIRELADGRIYTASQAVKAGLVDELGYLDTALNRAKQAAGLAEARVVTYHRPGTYSNNIYSGLPDSATLRRIADWSQLPVGTPQFLYLWGAP